MTVVSTVGKDNRGSNTVPTLKGQIIHGKPGPGEKYKTVHDEDKKKDTEKKEGDENWGIKAGDTGGHSIPCSNWVEKKRHIPPEGKGA